MSGPGKCDKADRTRKSAQNLRYVNENRHEKSRIRKLRKHLRRFPKDLAAARVEDVYVKKLGTKFAKI